MDQKLNPLSNVISVSISMLVAATETLSNYSLGQVFLKSVDRLLWIVEKTAQWSVPYNKTDKNNRVENENSSSDSSNGVVLIRPMPWVLFFPSLIFLRISRWSINQVAALLGSATISPIGLVEILQKYRRNIREIKYVGLRNIRQKNKISKNETYYTKLKQTIFNTFTKISYAILSRSRSPLQNKQEHLDMIISSGSSDSSDDEESDDDENNPFHKSNSQLSNDDKKIIELLQHYANQLESEIKKNSDETLKCLPNDQNHQSSGQNSQENEKNESSEIKAESNLNEVPIIKNGVSKNDLNLKTDLQDVQETASDYNPAEIETKTNISNGKTICPEITSDSKDKITGDASPNNAFKNESVDSVEISDNKTSSLENTETILSAESKE